MRPIYTKFEYLRVISGMNNFRLCTHEQEHEVVVYMNK